MIKTHSDDPDVADAAGKAYEIIAQTLQKLPPATSYDYGGQQLALGEYDVCQTCTKAIAEAQQARDALESQIETCEDETIKEHLSVAAALFASEAHTATLRAELHNGLGTEKILDIVNGYVYDRAIHDDYQHSHAKGSN